MDRVEARKRACDASVIERDQARVEQGAHGLAQLEGRGVGEGRAAVEAHWHVIEEDAARQRGERGARLFVREVKRTIAAHGELDELAEQLFLLVDHENVERALPREEREAQAMLRVHLREQ